MARFYDPQLFSHNTLTTLCEGASHHAQRVLRLSVGDTLTLFNGQAGEWQATIEQADKHSLQVRPSLFNPTDRTPVIDIHLWLPLIKGDRLDWALQKATEMGACSIQLYTSERTEVRLKPQRLEKKQRQWQKILITACEQCGLNRLPRLHPPQPLATLWPAATTDRRLVAVPTDGALIGQQQQRLSEAAVTLLTGPEGGLSAVEQQAAEQHGFTTFTLGERVLRAETAPIALMAALYSQFSHSPPHST